MSERVLLDPTSERDRDAPASARRARRRSTARDVGLLDITKPRGDVFLDRLEELLERAACTVERFAKPTFTKPAPDRPAPRDRREVRRGDRGPRRLRLVHVVQCARHREPRSRRRADGVRRIDRVRRRRRRAVARARRRPGARLRRAPDPGPHRRRAPRARRRRARRDCSTRSPSSRARAPLSRAPRRPGRRRRGRRPGNGQSGPTISASSAAASATRASSRSAARSSSASRGSAMRHRDIERAQREVADERSRCVAGLDPDDRVPGRVRAGELEPHLVGELVTVVNTVDDALGDECVEGVDPLRRARRRRESRARPTSSRCGPSGTPAPSRRRVRRRRPCRCRRDGSARPCRPARAENRRRASRRAPLPGDRIASGPVRRNESAAPHGSTTITRALRLDDPDRLPDQHLAVGRRPRRGRPVESIGSARP